MCKNLTDIRKISGFRTKKRGKSKNSANKSDESKVFKIHNQQVNKSESLPPIFPTQQWSIHKRFSNRYESNKTTQSKQWKKPNRLLNSNLKSHRNKSSHEIHPKKRVHYFTRKKTLKSVSNYITKSCEKEEKSKNN